MCFLWFSDVFCSFCCAHSVASSAQRTAQLVSWLQVEVESSHSWLTGGLPSQMRQATAWHLSSAQPGRSLNSNLLLPECCKWEATEEFRTQRRLFFFTPLASLPQSAASGSWNLRKSPGLSGLSLSQACRSFRGADLLALEVTYVWEKFTEPKTFRPKVGRGEPRRIDVLVRGAACSDKSKIHWPLCLWSRGKTAREKRKHKCFFFSMFMYIYLYILFIDRQT